MNALTKDDIERARSTPAGAKLGQALEMMSFGIELKRQSLRSDYPEASSDEIERLVLRWLERSDGQ